MLGFCRAVIKKDTLLASGLNQQDVSVGESVVFKCSAGASFPDSETWKSVLCRSNNFTRLDKFIDSCSRKVILFVSLRARWF